MIIYDWKWYYLVSFKQELRMNNLPIVIRQRFMYNNNTKINVKD